MIMFTTSFWANYNNSPTRNKALLDFIAIFPPSNHDSSEVPVFPVRSL